MDFRGSYLASRRLSDASPVSVPGWLSLPDSLCKLPRTPLLFPRDQSEKHHTPSSVICAPSAGIDIGADRDCGWLVLIVSRFSAMNLAQARSATYADDADQQSRLGLCSQAPGASSVLRWGAAATPVTTAVHLWCSVIWLIMLWCILQSGCVCFVNLFAPRLFLPSWLGFVFRVWSCVVMVILQFCICLFPCSIMSLILSLTPHCCSQS